MPTTGKGAPYPASTDSNNVAAQIQALAEWLDARPGVSALTTAQRDALSGADLWNGRQVFNLSTLRLERYDLAGAAWRTDAVSVQGGSLITPATAATRGLAVRARGDQAADLAAFENAAGQAVTRIDAASRLQAVNLFVFEANPGGLGAGQTLDQPVNFPTGSFATPPLVLVQAFGGGENGQDRLAVSSGVLSVTNTAAVVRLRNNGNVIQSVTYRVLAHGGL